MEQIYVAISQGPKLRERGVCLTEERKKEGKKDF